MEKPILLAPLTEKKLRRKLFHARVLALAPMMFIATLLWSIANWTMHVTEVDPLQTGFLGLVVASGIAFAGVGVDHLWWRCFAPLPARHYGTMLGVIMQDREFEIYREEVVQMGRAFNYADLRLLTLYSQELATWEFDRRDRKAERREQQTRLYRTSDNL